MTSILARRDAMAVLTALTLGSGCGTGPDTSFLEVGGEYTFTAAIVRRYDCDPGVAEPRDDARCGASSGVITIGFDTVQADLTLDTYRPRRVCDFDGCRDDPTYGRFTGNASVRIVQCEGTDGSDCEEQPAGWYDIAVSHATIGCFDERRRSGSVELGLPWFCIGHEGQTIVSIAVEIPGVFGAGFGVPDGREIRGTFVNDPWWDRSRVEGEWVIR